MTDWIEGLRSGRAWAFERLVRDYGDRLYRYFSRMVGPEAAEDLTQETFLRVYRAIGRYRPDAPFAAWVFTIANRLCADHGRRKGRRPQEVRLDEPLIAEATRESPDERELSTAVALAVARLPAPQRRVFILREEAGLSFREIAEVERVPLNTALGRMHDALNHLRKLLKTHAPR